MPRPAEIEAIRLKQTRAEAVVPFHEFTPDNVEWPVGGRLDETRGLEANPGRRLADAQEEPLDHWVDKRAGAFQVLGAAGGDGSVDSRDEQLCCGNIQVIEALGHRPAAGIRTPVELRVRQARHQT